MDSAHTMPQAPQSTVKAKMPRMGVIEVRLTHPLIWETGKPEETTAGRWGWKMQRWPVGILSTQFNKVDKMKEQAYGAWGWLGGYGSSCS